MSVLINKKSEQSQFQQYSSNSKNVVIVIYLLEAITKIGRHFPIIVLSLASLNIIMAANDFLASSFEFGILNSMFAAGGVVSLIQMHQRNRISSNYSENKESEFSNMQKNGMTVNG